MSLEAIAFRETLTRGVDEPSPTVIRRGHADGSQGCWVVVAGSGERVGRPPPPDLLEREPADSPVFDGIKR